MNRKRSSFSGKLGFVLSAAGASVGLGNIWRFPYLAAKYGGGIFLLVYIILALTFGYTMIVAETALGRMTKKSPVGAYESFGKSKWLSFGGWINAVIPILIVPYYSVIGSESHACEHLRDRDEHQRRTGLQGIRVTAGEGEDGRDDHETGHDRDRGIEDLNILGGIFDRSIFFHVGTEGDKDSHGDGQGVEHLTHSGYHRHP